MSSCTVKDCTNPTKAKGLCGTHYRRQRLGIDLDLPRMKRPSGGPCNHRGCPLPAKTMDFCATHYHQHRKTGRTQDIRPLAVGVWGDWYMNKAGYITRQRTLESGSRKRRGRREHQLQHREVYQREVLHREYLPGENVHHKNGVKHDNVVSNLELWVTLQPKGQRPEDLVEWAEEILRRYGSDTVYVVPEGSTPLITAK